MNDEIKDKEDFYIGWMSASPASFAARMKKSLLGILLIVVVIGIILAISQKKFGTGNFEFGELTTVKGIYSTLPVPNIKVVNGTTIFGVKNYISIPLVGFGKSGADGVMEELGKENNTTLDQKEITLKGTLLYNDGKLLMQVDANDKPLLSISGKAEMEPPALKDLGMMKIKGEIVDPKCYFGVMKPGMGKVHKDCAIRCILGGIPPVLRVNNEKGEANYYFIVGPNGEKMNERVQSFVAEPVEINARVKQYDDWIVLYVNDDKSIQRISGLSLARGNVQTIACVNSCSK